LLVVSVWKLQSYNQMMVVPAVPFTPGPPSIKPTGIDLVNPGFGIYTIKMTHQEVWIPLFVIPNDSANRLPVRRGASAGEVAELSQVIMHRGSFSAGLSQSHMVNVRTFYGGVSLDFGTHLPDLSAEILCSHGSGRIDGNAQRG
jgi:hypothetical protein